jgi:CrcB protein
VKLVVYVAVGGATGAVCRYLISGWLAQPYGTLLVNALGSLVLGVVVGLSSSLPPELRLLVGTGFCGGLTTFSTFAVETLALPPERALANVAANLLLSLTMASLGLASVRLLSGEVPAG